MVGYINAFFEKNHMQELWLTLYIVSKFELPYIDFMSEIRVVILPQSGQGKVIDSSYDNFHFSIGK